MSSPSLTPLEKCLSDYSLDVKYWANDFGEGHIMLGNREYLAEHALELTAEQQSELKRLDAMAKDLLDAYQGHDTWDVKNLRETVSIAYPEYRQAA